MLRVRMNDPVRHILSVGCQACLLAAIGYSLFWFGKTLVEGINPIPIHDHWTIFRFSERPIVDWFSGHNGHPLFFPRIFYYLDIHLASGTGHLLNSCSVLAETLTILLVLRLVQSGGTKTVGELLLTSACILPVAFASVNFLNYVYGFMFHWFLSLSCFVVAVVAVASLSCSRYGRRAWLFVGVAITASIVSALSMGSGILAIVFAAILALVTPQTKRVRFVLVLAAITGVALYYVTYLWHQATVLDLPKLRFVDATIFVSIYIGAPVAQAIDASLNLFANQAMVVEHLSLLLFLSGIIGIAGIMTMLWHWKAAWVQPSGPTRTSQLALLCIQMWVIVTSLATYSQRLDLGIQEAMALRYWNMGILFWITVPASTILTPKGLKIGKTLSAMFVIALTLLIVTSQAKFQEWSREIHDSQYNSAVMLAAGVDDIGLLTLTFHPKYGQANRWQDVNWIRERNAALFAEDWLNNLGQPLDKHYSVTGGDRCVGNIFGAPTWVSSGDHSGWRLTGWAVELTRHQAIRHLILADERKQIVGFGWGGVIPAKPEDVPAPWKGQRVGWAGYAPKTVNSAIRVYGEIGAGSVCLVHESILPRAPAVSSE